MSDVGQFAMFLAMGGIAISFLVGPIGQALARRIGGKRGDGKDGLTTGEMAAARIAELEARVAELDGQVARIHELEERLEFAERLLAPAERDRPALGAGPAEAGLR